MHVIADREQIEQTIHTVAMRRLGVADVNIVPLFERDWELYQETQTPTRSQWFSLHVLDGGKWKMLGRRRTKAELLALVSTIDPRHVDGKRF